MGTSPSSSDDTYLLSWLAIAVHASLSLLMARGVPGEVVVEDGVERFLEVDALREAIRGHEDAPLGIRQIHHARLAFGGR